VEPVVTVIISAFNSEAFIAETLDSVYDQTWKKLEVVVTDDCSEDGTVEVCRNWMDARKSRFLRTEIITSKFNTGVSGNANRGIQAAGGEWIKFLGADDTLKPTCIEDNIRWIVRNQEIKVLFSRIEVYRETFDRQNLVSTIPGDPFNPNWIMAPGRDAASQYRMLLVSDRIHFSPSVFINRDTIVSLGGFDEQFRTFEDYPMWLKLTKNGYRLHFMDSVTVNYRKHSGAINNTDIDYLVKPNYFRSEKFRRQYTYPDLPSVIRNDHKFRWLASQIFRNRLLNRDMMVNRWLYGLLTVYLNPFRYLIWVKTRFSRHPLPEEYLM
jgi:alpha-1,3-rhamnosyltransferase